MCEYCKKPSYSTSVGSLWGASIRPTPEAFHSLHSMYCTDSNNSNSNTDAKAATESAQQIETFYRNLKNSPTPTLKQLQVANFLSMIIHHCMVYMQECEG